MLDIPRMPTLIVRGGEMRQGRDYHNRRSLGSGDWLLIYTMGGSGRFMTRKGVLKTRPGDVALYAPDDYQEYSTDEEPGEWHLLWTHFPAQTQTARYLQWPVGGHGMRHLFLPPGENRKEAAAALRRLIHLSGRTSPGYPELAANALEAALLWVHLSRGSQPQEADPRVRKAIDYLTTHLHQPFDLNRLATYCGASVSRLSGLFKAHLNTSPLQFQEHYRMQYARELLRRTSLSIAAIAADVGYHDPFYFSSRFRRHHGKSPSAYRREQGGQQQAAGASGNLDTPGRNW